MSTATNTTEKQKVWIPEISDDRLRELAERIKPVIRFSKNGEKLSQTAEGNPYYIEGVDLRNTAYAWTPSPTVEVTGLVELAEITTYHRFGYIGYFKPSIAEVLAQIPEEYLSQVVAFEIVSSPPVSSDDVGVAEALNANYHTVRTKLYT